MLSKNITEMTNRNKNNIKISRRRCKKCIDKLYNLQEVIEYTSKINISRYAHINLEAFLLIYPQKTLLTPYSFLSCHIKFFKNEFK